VAASAAALLATENGTEIRAVIAATIDVSAVGTTTGIAIETRTAIVIAINDPKATDRPRGHPAGPNRAQTRAKAKAKAKGSRVVVAAGAAAGHAVAAAVNAPAKTTRIAPGKTHSARNTGIAIAMPMAVNPRRGRAATA
jgi:hypothetical protein